jgi:hypothetical protein
MLFLERAYLRRYRTGRAQQAGVSACGMPSEHDDGAEPVPAGEIIRLTAP